MAQPGPVADKIRALHMQPLIGLWPNYVHVPDTSVTKILVYQSQDLRLTKFGGLAVDPMQPIRTQ